MVKHVSFPNMTLRRLLAGRADNDLTPNGFDLNSKCIGVPIHATIGRRSRVKRREDPKIMFEE